MPQNVDTQGDVQRSTMFALHCPSSSCSCVSATIYEFVCLRVFVYIYAIAFNNMSIWICNLAIYSKNFNINMNGIFGQLSPK